jgi:hypothetical protein
MRGRAKPRSPLAATSVVHRHIPGSEHVREPLHLIREHRRHDVVFVASQASLYVTTALLYVEAGRLPSDGDPNPIRHQGLKKVVLCNDEPSGLSAIIAIHFTDLGAATGTCGCVRTRMSRPR